MSFTGSVKLAVNLISTKFPTEGELIRRYQSTRHLLKHKSRLPHWEFSIQTEKSMAVMPAATFVNNWLSTLKPGAGSSLTFFVISPTKNRSAVAS